MLSVLQFHLVTPNSKNVVFKVRTKNMLNEYNVIRGDIKERSTLETEHPFKRLSLL